MLLRKKIFYSFITCCILLLTLELGARVVKSVKCHNLYWLLFGSPWADRYAVPKVDQDRTTEIQVADTIQGEGYYLFRPGVHIMQMVGQKAIESRVNSLGFRGNEIFLKKPKGIVRIFCLGGSSTYGVNVKDGETYPVSLGRCLGRGFEVVNAGFPGANSSSVLALFRAEVLSLEPDIAILYAAHNDHSAKTTPRSPSLALKIHGLFYYRSVFYTLASEKISMLLAGHSDPACDLYSGIIPDRQDRERIIKLYRNNIRELIKSAQDKGVKLILVAQPLKFPVDYPKLANPAKLAELQKKKEFSWSEYAYYMQSELIKELHDIGAAYGVPVIDCVKIFDNLPLPQRMGVFFDTVHLTPEGNELLGNILCDFIKSGNN